MAGSALSLLGSVGGGSGSVAAGLRPSGACPWPAGVRAGAGNLDSGSRRPGNARGGLAVRAGGRCQRWPAWKGDGRRPQPAGCVWKDDVSEEALLKKSRQASPIAPKKGNKASGSQNQDMKNEGVQQDPGQDQMEE
ncbi:unnamed protein product [Miscanthus lutarioriparius]|uniref:Uncharacterized protein n=1 Tax=Miscanthus lutarioriparius TaxID=422564 RepID=A0A811R6A9_9POAL|nr:unnamed protein product [Miscanthus lutarioriparius]